MTTRLLRAVLLTLALARLACGSCGPLDASSGGLARCEAAFPTVFSMDLELHVPPVGVALVAFSYADCVRLPSAADERAVELVSLYGGRACELGLDADLMLVLTLGGVSASLGGPLAAGWRRVRVVLDGAFVTSWVDGAVLAPAPVALALPPGGMASGGLALGAGQSCCPWRAGGPCLERTGATLAELRIRAGSGAEFFSWRAGGAGGVGGRVRPSIERALNDTTGSSVGTKVRSFLRTRGEMLGWVLALAVLVALVLAGSLYVRRWAYLRQRRVAALAEMRDGSRPAAATTVAAAAAAIAPTRTRAELPVAAAAPVVKAGPGNRGLAAGW